MGIIGVVGGVGSCGNEMEIKGRYVMKILLVLMRILTSLFLFSSVLEYYIKYGYYYITLRAKVRTAIFSLYHVLAD